MKNEKEKPNNIHQTPCCKRVRNNHKEYKLVFRRNFRLLLLFELIYHTVQKKNNIKTEETRFPQFISESILMVQLGNVWHHLIGTVYVFENPFCDPLHHRQ